MDYSKELEGVREYFKADKYASDTGAVIEEIGDHYAKVSLALDERHLNAVGGVMGGVYFTLADFAFAVAANWQKRGVVALHTSASFVGVPKTKRIFAEARLIKDGRSTCSYQVDVTDENGSPVTLVQCLGFHKDM